MPSGIATTQHTKTFPSPFALVASQAGGWQLTAVDAAAAALGLAPGQLLADARARVPALTTQAAAPAGDRAALKALSLWCTRFSPYVAPWPRDGEDHGSAGLTLDSTGCAHLFGGEAAMLEALRAALARIGFTAHIALADSIGAAHALSRHGSNHPIVVTPGDQRAAIAALPVAALRIPSAMAMTLTHLGFAHIGDLLPLPRAPLAARFGASLLTRLDQALGRAQESFSPRLPHAPLRAQAVLAEPIAREEHVRELVARLAGDLAPMLERKGLGARRLALTLFRVDGQTVRLSVRCAEPSREAAHLTRLFALRLAALHADYDAGFGFEAARLDVTGADPIDAAQQGLGDDRAAARAQRLARLTDRLASRLGADNVLRALPRESHIPERALRLAPAQTTRAERFGNVVQRPALLLPRPEPAEVMALLPEGPPQTFCWRGVSYRTRRAEGPERIAPEWWRDDSGRTRDYYRVEDSEGRRFWLYRDGLYGEPAPPRWFVHGIEA